MKIQSARRLLFPLSCSVALLLSACGGGAGTVSNDVQPATTTPITSAQAILSVTAPAPDSASVNGDVSLSQLKAAMTTAQAETVAVTPAVEPAVTSATSQQVSTATIRKGDAAAPSGNTIYVTPSGDDAWSGSLSAPNATRTDGPVKTLPVAQSIARARLAMMAAGTAREPVRVRIGAGNYYLTSPLEFTPADSGTAAAMVYYEAIKPGTVLISGGVPLVRSATAAPANQVRFDNPTAAGSAYSGGGQLFVNGKRAVLARQPNEGQFWFLKTKVPLSTESSGDSGREAFTVSPEATAWINGLNANDRSRAVMNVMQSWTDGHHRFSAQAAPVGAIRVTPRAITPFLLWGLSQRAYVENVAAALDAPREWLWDANGISYIPAANEPAATVTGVMPVLEKLVVIKGDWNNGNVVQNLWFSGLSFAHTRYLVPSGGLTDSQAGIDTGAAIEVDGAVGIVIDNCDVSHTSGYGVWFRRGVRDSRVTNSTFVDMGAGGLKFGQANQQLNEMQTGANSAAGNRISDTGKIFAGSVGIWVGQGFDNLIANNAVMNTSYTGISVGWTWGFGAVTSGRNRIVNNLLSNIGQGQLSDIAAIYTLGISPGTVISGNVVREVRGYPGYGPGAWGIYNDEGSSNILVEGNLVVGTDSGGYHLNYGRSNTVRKNLFALGSKFEMRVTNTDPANTRLAFEDNIMFPLVQQPFDSFARAPDVLFKNVLLSDSSAGIALDLSYCGTLCTNIAAVLTAGADPRAIALSGIDSATVAWVAQTAQNAGPANLVTAINVADPPVVPVVIAVAPPTPLVLDIAGAAVGSQPAGIVYMPADAAVMSVVRDTSSPSGSCIAVRDSAFQLQPFFPYVYASLNHDKGISTAEFSVKIDSSTLLGYEWRDGGNPYKSGPALQISAAGVVVKGRVVAAAPAGQWLTLRIVSAVSDANALWTLEVTNNATGIKTVVNNLAFASAGWSKLMWTGFTSDATTSSTACIGSLKITSSIL